MAAILRGDMAGLAHAGDHDAAGGAGQQVDRAAEAAVQAGGQRLQPRRLGVQHRAGDVQVVRLGLATSRSAAVRAAVIFGDVLAVPGGSDRKHGPVNPA